MVDQFISLTRWIAIGATALATAGCAGPELEQAEFDGPQADVDKVFLDELNLPPGPVDVLATDLEGQVAFLAYNYDCGGVCKSPDDSDVDGDGRVEASPHVYGASIEVVSLDSDDPLDWARITFEFDYSWPENKFGGVPPQIEQISVGENEVFVLTRAHPLAAPALDPPAYRVYAFDKQALLDGDLSGAIADPDAEVESEARLPPILSGSNPIPAIAAVGSSLFVVECSPYGGPGIYQCALTRYLIADHKIEDEQVLKIENPQTKKQATSWNTMSLSTRLVTAGAHSGAARNRVYLIRPGNRLEGPAYEPYPEVQYYGPDGDEGLSVHGHGGHNPDFDEDHRDFGLVLDSRALETVSVSPRGNLVALGKVMATADGLRQRHWVYDAATNSETFRQDSVGPGNAPLRGLFASDSHTVEAIFDTGLPDPNVPEGDALLASFAMGAIPLDSSEASGATSCLLERRLFDIEGPIVAGGGHITWISNGVLKRWSPDSCISK